MVLFPCEPFYLTCQDSYTCGLFTEEMKNEDENQTLPK